MPNRDCFGTAAVQSMGAEVKADEGTALVRSEKSFRRHLAGLGPAA